MARPKRYTPEQITRILKQQEAGMKVARFPAHRAPSPAGEIPVDR